jgi:hypothetical protein
LIELVRWECNPTIDYACPGCGAARSGAPLIRDRHGLERSTQVGFTRLAHIGAPISGKPEIGVCKKTGKYRAYQPARRSRRCFGSLILRRREAPSRRMRRAIPLPSCFETPRLRAAPQHEGEGARCILAKRTWCEAPTCGCKNGDRGRSSVSGLFFTGNRATATCRAVSRPVGPLRLRLR